ncbi:MAG: ACT domain-containing protein [Rhizobiaceae bacterium]|nr:ACT domain-containing protein [Rhizobiaceae bacterium]
MSGELALSKLLQTLTTKLVDGVYVFVTLAEDAVPEDLSPRMIFQESEGTTLILLQSQAEAHGLDYEFPCRMITLNVHSSLEAVGFIAHIATELARHDMGVNPVSGFYHDHLFVPNGREGDAVRILEKMAQTARNA